MTTPAKEVIAAAILEDARHMGALAGELPIEHRLSAAILAALDAAGYVVVPREPTEGTIPAAGSIDFPYHDIRDDRAMIAAQESKP